MPAAEEQYDLFISYAHIDNEALVDGEPGWISSFHQVLERRLRQLLGEQVAIWRDRELRGNDKFDLTIADKIRRAALLVSVVTPRYAKSDYCNQELATFVEHAEELADQTPHDKSRVFKVLKTPIPLQQHPDPIRDLLGYEFYRADPESRRIREYGLQSKEYRDEFIQTLDDLAQEITELLGVVRGAANGAATGAPPEHTVYLATTTSDVREYRLSLKRDLQAQGVRVLPRAELPMNAPELEAAVARDLAEAELSIHLLGEQYGVIPEASERSDVHHQITLAGEHGGLQRVIWFPPGLSPQDERQRELVAALQTDDAVQQGAEVLESTVEELKAAVGRQLEERARAQGESQPESPAAQAGAGAGPLWLYVLHVAEDETAVAPVIDHLWDQGFEVRTPLFEGDERALRQEHEQNLKLCDAFLVFYGHGGELWIRKALADLKRARGLGRTKPVRGQLVYVAPPEGPRKQRYRTHEAEVVLQQGEFDSAAVAPWLATLAEAAK